MTPPRNERPSPTTERQLDREKPVPAPVEGVVDPKLYTPPVEAEFVPAHGRNQADRADTVDEHGVAAPTNRPAVTDASNDKPVADDATVTSTVGIPLSRRIDEGQNTGPEGR